MKRIDWKADFFEFINRHLRYAGQPGHNNWEAVGRSYNEVCLLGSLLTRSAANPPALPGEHDMLRLREYRIQRGEVALCLGLVA